MRRAAVLSMVVTALIGLSGCGATLFSDNFEADVAGAPPAASPPGDPADDSLTVQGPVTAITVIDSVPLGSKAVKVDRTDRPPQVALECVTGGGPNTDGNYYITFKAYSSTVAEVPELTTTIKSSMGQRAFDLRLTGGEFRLSSGDAENAVVGGGYLENAVHSIGVRIDLGTSRFWLAVDGVDVASDKPFLDAGFSDVHLLRFEYPDPLLEALPASYVVDDIVIRK